jgi:RES domain-containing protein
MNIYRICQSTYKDDLSGTGAELYGGRWNSKGIKALYTTQHISLAVLEILVNINRNDQMHFPDFHLLEIEIPDELISIIDSKKMKKGWNLDTQYTQYIGDEFIRSRFNMALLVPSVVVPEEHNLIINPIHKNFKQMKLKKSRLYKLDSRLFAY